MIITFKILRKKQTQIISFKLYHLIPVEIMLNLENMFDLQSILLQFRIEVTQERSLCIFISGYNIYVV